jgi:beta-galactosidase
VVRLRVALPAIVIAFAGVLADASAADMLDLSGRWRFALDREDAGVAGRWQDRRLPDAIRLPGILNAQGYGDEIGVDTPWVLSLYDKNWFLREDYRAYAAPGRVKVPFLSQPPRHYLGAAWYGRDVDVPRAWRGKRVVLHLERPRWGSTAWVDGREAGARRSLVAEHEYDLGMLAPGRHRISVRVDSRMLMNYRPDAHSVSDSLGMSWNGIVGKIALQATPPVYIDDVQLFPRVDDRSVLVRLRIGNALKRPGSGAVTVNGERFPAAWAADGGSLELRVQYPRDAQTWDEWHPVLHKLRLLLNSGDARELSFGFVQIGTRGTDIVLNGRPVFMRGTHHGGDFPLTGYPPTDVAYWKKIFRINKEWGINHIRFHSFTPPEAAFQAADEVGIYLQPEPGMWNEVSPGTPMEAMLYEETEHLIRAYGNHPSFLMLSPSNEPKGKWKEAFDKWIAHYRAVDPRRIYSNGTGHTEPTVPGLEQGTDFLAVQRIGPKPLRNKTGWFGRDYAASLEGVTVPVLSHELGQWVAYPDFGVIDKFTGYLRPGNYEIFRDSARAHGLLDKNHAFALASGRYQLLCYKEEIEAVMRTRGMSGYQLLDLHDYLGQGTALVGILDTFWESKGYATPAAFRRFNGETVPLARLERRVLQTGDALDVPIEIAHYGQGPLAGAAPWWRIEDAGGKAVLTGAFAQADIPIGKNTPLGRIVVPAEKLAALTATGQYKLVVGLADTDIANDWDFWLYPKAGTSGAAGVLVTHSWPEAEGRLAEGGTVLYLPRKADLDWTSPPLADVPVFWNRLMNPGWSRMLGLWIDRDHPALAGFPTTDHFDWQWAELAAGSRAMNLDRLPRGLQPIVQPIDDWNRNYKLGALFEARVGPGRLMISTFDLEDRLDARPAARALRKSVLDYMSSSGFRPAAEVAPDALRAVLFDTRVMKKLGAQASGWPDAGRTIDGDPNTYALVAAGNAAALPALRIAFPAAVAFDGLVLMPRQNHRDHEGDVREWLVEASDDGEGWREVRRAQLGSTFAPQTVRFDGRVSARYLRLTALSGFGADGVRALADVAVIYAGPPLPEEGGDIAYQRSRSTSVDVDEAGMDDRRAPQPKRRRDVPAP